MASYGLKVSKELYDVKDSVLANTVFDSRYSSVMLLEKKDITFKAPSGVDTPSGTATYTHGLGYAPLVLATVSYTASTSTYSNGPIPYNFTETPAGAFSGYFLRSRIDMKVYTTKVDLLWETTQHLFGTTYALSADVDYTVTLHIYSYELGYKT